MRYNQLLLYTCLSLQLRHAHVQDVYTLPRVPEEAYFAETFDWAPLDRTWVMSQALREDEEGVIYDGQWDVQEPHKQVLTGNKGLVLKSAGRHHAISAHLRTVFYFKDKPLILQYEVLFQNGENCGGAYIKLLSHTNQLRLGQFCEATPYSIMFGPDKCGGQQKIHFIIRHRNPVTGQYQEKHARQPDVELSEYFTDRQAHLYTLRLYPDSAYEILIDGALVSQGSLLEDMDPPVNPARMIPDPRDVKPDDWDDRPHIPDPQAAKPEDWDGDAPKLIPDPSVKEPLGWLQSEPPYIPDPNAQRPEDWYEEMDGVWEAPHIPNPACSQAEGCGPWEPPLIHNPAYKGKWKPPTINNPHYKGQWRARLIPNPGYFEDLHPFRMDPVAALGLELWSVSGGVLFDNILLCSELETAQRWTEETWGQRRKPGVFMRLILAAQKRPWLWGLYVFTAGLPIILFISIMWPDKDYYYKKSDEPQPSGPPDLEGLISSSSCSDGDELRLRKRETRRAQKADLELKVDRE